MTNYNAAARVLDEFMLELIEKGTTIKGMTIPPHVVDDLKSGRSLINIEQRQPGDADIGTKIAAILQNVEMNLLSLSETSVGREYADEWQKRIDGAYREEPVSPSPKPSFVSGVPKGKHWVRVQTAELTAVGELQKLLGDFALSALTQEDGYMLIHGEKEDVSAFLKEIRRIVGKTGKNGE